MQARIYRDIKTVMQSGRANTKHWVLEYEPQAPLTPDPLMGWSASRDTQRQVRLYFDTAEEAVRFAKGQNLVYSLETPKERKTKPKAYADNFAYTRLGRWTH